MNEKLFLPITTTGTVRPHFISSILNSFQGRNVHIEFFFDSLAPRARNRAAAYFLTHPLCADRDYLLFIDGDIIFAAQHINWLMESEEPILAGIYCKKEKGIAPCLNTLPMKEGEDKIECGGYIEIARAGTGFLRIHKSVFEKMKEVAPEYTNHGSPEWDFFPTGVKNKEYLSEDWFFCDKARELGFKVMLDSRIQVRHEGTAIYPLDNEQKSMEVEPAPALAAVN